MAKSELIGDQFYFGHGRSSHFWHICAWWPRDSMELRVAKKFRIGAKISDNYESDVYAGVNVFTGEDVAIKLESLRCRTPELRNEPRVYRKLKNERK